LSKSEIEPKPIPIHFPNLKQKVFLFGKNLKNNLENFFPRNREFVDRTLFFKILSADWPQFTTQKIIEDSETSFIESKIVTTFSSPELQCFGS
jgi:hypothetical protein